ncbi:hypothetical protein RND71_027199 [Anisodus tanguticus]|uniref:Protein SDA1 n=1 Tax=Anisodus tanguticus TaxID=243964 RepID=A0AAE1RNU7_9SOLA|nr:hypothetical protein RND71_027199 [Anisodus tanguticus]
MPLLLFVQARLWRIYRMLKETFRCNKVTLCAGFGGMPHNKYRMIKPNKIDQNTLSLLKEYTNSTSLLSLQPHFLGFLFPTHHPISGRHVSNFRPHAPSELTAEGIAASGLTSEKLSLPNLQSKMKCDPEGYESELILVYEQFKSSMNLFEEQAACSFTSLSGVSTDSTVSKDLGDRSMFLSHVTPFYPKLLVNFPKELAILLKSSAKTLPPGLRVHVTQALILLINRKIVDIGETLELFMELQTLGDRVLRKLAFSHIVHSIRRMNQKHKNDMKNRALQNILFGLLQQEDEAKAKRSLITLCEIHRRRVWFDDRTANAICSACFHSSSRIMIASLSFLLDYEKIEDDSDGDMADSEDEQTANPQVVVNKEAIYKANNKGTSSSKKKKQAKLQRVVRSMKKQQRVQSENNNTSYYSPLNHLKDAQGFAEKLFSRLQTCNERFEPHQRDVTNLLAAAVQACHDMVPPDAVEPLFKQVVNQFVHDRSRPELMTEDLLQDLVLYKKSNEKAVSAAARSLLTLFREAKKDARNVLAQHGFKLPSSDQLSTKRVDAAKLEANIRKKLSKEERLAIIRAGREDRGRYQAKTALKKKKTGGSSNQQKEHKKLMPLAAKRSKVARSKIEKKRKQARAGKQFRGRKAWK